MSEKNENKRKINKREEKMQIGEQITGKENQKQGKGRGKTKK